MQGLEYRKNLELNVRAKIRKLPRVGTMPAPVVARRSMRQGTTRTSTRAPGLAPGGAAQGSSDAPDCIGVRPTTPAAPARCTRGWLRMRLLEMLGLLVRVAVVVAFVSVMMAGLLWFLLWTFGQLSGAPAL